MPWFESLPDVADLGSVDNAVLLEEYARFAGKRQTEPA
jgi:hypothetical protein